MANSKSRIWELDALRGVCILCVIVVHFLFDLSFFGGFQLTLPAWYVFLQEYGGAIFVLLSGCCATLGTRSVRRGCIVFAAGMLITGVTYGMYRLGMSGADVVVKFGVLHLLGVCMIIYPLFKKLPPAALTGLALSSPSPALPFGTCVVPQHWLFPLGLIYEGFMSSDYFPRFPAAGLFFIGAAIGKTAYRGKTDAAPRHVPGKNPAPAFSAGAADSRCLFIFCTSPSSTGFSSWSSLCKNNRIAQKLPPKLCFGGS